MNWKTSKILVIAHRGDTKKSVENTLPAVDSALKLGADGIEVDLQLTRDGEVVVFHDRDLRRLAGRNEIIEQTSLATLRNIRLNGAILPTLDELLDLVRDRALLNLEIKNAHFFSPLLERRIVDSLKTFHLDESILISSFHPSALWWMKRGAPHLSRGYLFENKYPLHRVLMPWLAPRSIHAPLSRTSRSLVDEAHKADRRFFVWTVNDENDTRRCIEYGVDGIFTDEPQRLLKLIGNTENP